MMSGADELMLRLRLRDVPEAKAREVVAAWTNVEATLDRFRAVAGLSETDVELLKHDILSLIDG
jgi:hypothetical protein